MSRRTAWQPWQMRPLVADGPDPAASRVEGSDGQDATASAAACFGTDADDPHARVDPIALHKAHERRCAHAEAQAAAKGYADGWAEGRTAGYEEGHAQGLEAGRTRGRAEGYDTGHQDGYADGHAEGLEQGRQAARAQAHAQWAQMQALLDGAAQAVDTLDVAVGEQLAALAGRIAQRVLHTHLARHPEDIRHLVTELLRSAPGEHSRLHVRLHPDDVTFVETLLDQEALQRPHRLVPDASLSRGDCVLETDEGAIDARLQTRWERVSAALGAPDATPADVTSDPTEEQNA